MEGTNWFSFSLEVFIEEASSVQGFLEEGLCETGSLLTPKAMRVR